MEISTYFLQTLLFLLLTMQLMNYPIYLKYQSQIPVDEKYFLIHRYLKTRDLEFFHY